MYAHGAGLRVEPLAEDDSLEERDGLLVIPAAGVLDDDLVRQLRDHRPR